MLEYFTEIYAIPIFTTIVGLAIIYAYDKFEKKQYTGAIYFRLAIVLYISAFASLYIFKHIGALIGSGVQSGGGSVNIDSPPVTSTAGEFSKLHLEQFKTGVPTF
jgi:hypothetical protein